MKQIVYDFQTGETTIDDVEALEVEENFDDTSPQEPTAEERLAALEMAMLDLMMF